MDDDFPQLRKHIAEHGPTAFEYVYRLDPSHGFTPEFRRAVNRSARIYRMRSTREPTRRAEAARAAREAFWRRVRVERGAADALVALLRRACVP